MTIVQFALLLMLSSSERNQPHFLIGKIPKKLAEGFSKFFVEKIAKIMQVLKSSGEITTGYSYVETDYVTDKRLYIFSPVCMVDIIQVTKESPSKYCELDPLPTNLLK